MSDPLGSAFRHKIDFAKRIGDVVSTFAQKQSGPFKTSVETVGDTVLIGVQLSKPDVVDTVRVGIARRLLDDGFNLVTSPQPDQLSEEMARFTARGFIIAVLIPPEGNSDAIHRQSIS
jgi:hypothetical protein